MREGNPASRLDRAHHRFDLLRRTEAVTWMRDAGNRDRVDWDEGWQPTTDIHETAKRFQMGYPPVDHIARNQTRDVLFQTVLLDLPTGETWNHRAIFRAGKPCNPVTDRLIYPRDDRDITGCPFGDPKRTLLPRNDPPIAAHINNQVVLRITDDRPTFQNFSGELCLLKRSQRFKRLSVCSGVEQHAFGFEMKHFEAPPLCTYHTICGPVMRCR